MLLLNQLIIVFSLSIMVFLVFSYFRIPAVVGFLLTGILAGPHGIGLVKSVQEVEVLAEIGIILLLFTIGIEFSIKDFLKMKRNVILGGTIQVSLTIMVSALILLFFGQPVNKAVFMGFLISLSSTAIVLKILQDKAEIDSPHGRTTLGILIFQDIAVVPMMLAIPLLAGVTDSLGGSLAATLLKAAIIIFVVIVGAKWVVPKLLYLIAKTKNRELFLLSILVICFSVAWLTSAVGLSLALGAFLAGLMISESGYNHDALGSILPFKDIFTSIFFISIGMLLDINILFMHPWLIILIALGVIFLKGFIGALTVIALGFPLRTSILVGLKILQVGEFSFILSKVGSEYGLLTGNTYQIFLAVSIVTMAATPFIIEVAGRFAEFIVKLPLPDKLKAGYHSEKFTRKNHKSNHIIIVGFGLNGKNLAQASKTAQIDYTIIEMDPQIVREQRKEGYTIFRGDATHAAVLEFADIKQAKIIVIAISDKVATRKIVNIARKLNPKIHIIVRTRYFKEVNNLCELGADEIIPEEFETSIEIFTRVLEKYLIPREEIECFVTKIRARSYEMFRTLSDKNKTSFDLLQFFPQAVVNSFRVKENSPIVNKTLADIDLRKEYGVTLLSVQRESGLLLIPDGTMRFYPDDIIALIGEPENIHKARSLF